ncbi:MAG TPA: RNase adapter RapZ [Clostridiales bacterium]|nr:RNase adapter RapZ [Clostridiales bacterium]
MRFLIVTGLSGAGKTQALRYLEDMGYFCIDNLPPKLIPKFVELCYQSEGKIERVAIVVDIRGGEFFDDLFGCLRDLEDKGYRYEILFLEATTETLIKRYKETRRKHPLAGAGRVVDAINKERELLAGVKLRANSIIDTTNLQPKQLKKELVKLFLDDRNHHGLFISIMSFGFKYGIPLDTDLVFDVRFLPNPFWIDRFRHYTGRQPEVREYVLKSKEAKEFLSKLEDMLDFLIPLYLKEGKSQLVISIGCTGGKHRSVTIANFLYERLLDKNYKVMVDHRDVDHDPPR